MKRWFYKDEQLTPCCSVLSGLLLGLSIGSVMILMALAIGGQR